LLGLTLGDAIEHLYRYGKLEDSIVKALSVGSRARLLRVLEVLEGEGVVQRAEEAYVLVDPLRGLEVLNSLRCVDVSRLTRFIEWSDFEEFVARVLSEEGYRVFRDVRRTSISRFQIDVLGLDPSRGIGLVVECKRWQRVLSSMSRLAEAARSHVERTRKLVRVCEWVAVSMPELRRVRELLPVIVTLAQPSIPIVEGVPIVSVATLRDFARNAEDYAEELEAVRIENRCWVRGGSTCGST